MANPLTVLPELFSKFIWYMQYAFAHLIPPRLISLAPSDLLVFVPSPSPALELKPASTSYRQHCQESWLWFQ
jgi:hypothetical protein